MAAVNLPIQLAAKISVAKENTGAHQVANAKDSGENAGKSKDDFAAVLAQHVDAPPARPDTVGAQDVSADTMGKLLKSLRLSAADDASDAAGAGGDASSAVLTHLQQLDVGATPIVAPVIANIVAQMAGHPAEDGAGASAVGEVRPGQQISSQILQAMNPGRQGVAGDSASFAEEAVHPSPNLELGNVTALTSDASSLPQGLQSPAGALGQPAQVQSAAQSTQPQPIPQHVSSAGWGAAVGERVMWMVGQQTQSAEIHLHPPSLGPLEIKLDMSDGQANLTFSTPHAPVKEALDAAAPRLREMLGESGINLGSVSVNVGTPSQQQEDTAQAGRQGTFLSRQQEVSPAESGVNVSMTRVNSSQGRGLVDYFA